MATSARPGTNDQRLVPAADQVRHHLDHRVDDAVDDRQEGFRHDRDAHAADRVGCDLRGGDATRVTPRNSWRISRTGYAVLVNPRRRNHQAAGATRTHNTTTVIAAGTTPVTHVRPATRTCSGSALSYSTRTSCPTCSPDG